MILIGKEEVVKGVITMISVLQNMKKNKRYKGRTKL